MSTILALDLGMNTGWAIYKPSEGIEFGSEDFSVKKRKRGTPPRCTSFMDFHCWLDNLMSIHGIKTVYYEEVMRHAGTRAAHCYGAFECLMEISGHTIGIKPIGIPVGTIKKFATGNGHAKKPEMISSAISAGLDVTDDDQADAVHLLRYVLYGKD